MTENRRKVLILISGATLLLGLGIAYLVFASGRVDKDIAAREERAMDAVSEFERNNPTPIGDDAASAPTATQVPTTLASATGPVPQPGEVVVINRVPGDDYGRLAIRHEDGTRTLLDRRCLRMHVDAGHGVCLSENDGVVPTYTATLFDAADPAQRDIRSYEIPLPSRARVSADGSLASSTSFITGSSYEDLTIEASTVVTIGAFDRGQLIGVNQFSVDSTEARYNGGSRMFWGVAFIDDNDFYVTGFFGDVPEIMQGDIDARTLRPTGFEGSCPSLSPDQKTLVFKRARADEGFDLVAVDLASGDSWTLAESRSVDDQVEWLDNDTILYALHPDGEESLVQPEFDVWKLDLAEGSEPEIFLPAADSPAAIRG